ncbi:MAG: hypothetical protein ABI981_08540 [Betaproteobacteria bacterium]
MIALTNIAGIAQVVVRNIVPLAGIVFFHWSAANVLILYFVDTLLSFAVIFAGLAKALDTEPRNDVLARFKGEFIYVFVALFISAFIGIPIGMPVGIALATSDFSFQFALHDESLCNGLIVQALLSVWSYMELRRALATYSPDQLKLKRRFGFVFMRWFAVLFACYVLLDFMGGNLAVYALVLVYIGASIFAEVAPDRFLQVMPGGKEYTKEDADGATAKPKTSAHDTSKR